MVIKMVVCRVPRRVSVENHCWLDLIMNNYEHCMHWTELYIYTTSIKFTI